MYLNTCPPIPSSFRVSRIMLLYFSMPTSEPPKQITVSDASTHLGGCSDEAWGGQRRIWIDDARLCAHIFSTFSAKGSPSPNADSKTRGESCDSLLSLGT